MDILDNYKTLSGSNLIQAIDDESFLNINDVKDLSEDESDELLKSALEKQVETLKVLINALKKAE